MPHGMNGGPGIRHPNEAKVATQRECPKTKRGVRYH
jgi:hypothetical protein